MTIEDLYFCTDNRDDERELLVCQSADISIRTLYSETIHDSGFGQRCFHY